MPMPFSLTSRPAFTLVGISCRASNADASPIGALWGRFSAGGGPAQLPGRIDDRILSLYTDYESDHSGPYTVIIGCAVERAGRAPDGLVAQRVPASAYAVFDAVGPQPDTLIEVWGRILDTPIARTYSGDFEEHDGSDRVRILVAVEPD
jgi:predicted transcriptional regulator YdeE